MGKSLENERNNLYDACMPEVIHRVLVGVGSNENAEERISRARLQVAGLRKESTFGWTKPVQTFGDALFLNGVWEIETSLDEKSFKEYLRSIEAEAGRDRTSQVVALDLDILVWDEHIQAPEVFQRDFLRRAILEVAPHLRDSLGGSIVT